MRCDISCQNIKDFMRSLGSIFLGGASLAHFFKDGMMLHPDFPLRYQAILEIKTSTLLALWILRDRLKNNGKKYLDGAVLVSTGLFFTVTGACRMLDVDTVYMDNTNFSQSDDKQLLQGGIETGLGVSLITVGLCRLSNKPKEIGNLRVPLNRSLTGNSISSNIGTTNTPLPNSVNLQQPNSTNSHSLNNLDSNPTKSSNYVPLGY